MRTLENTLEEIRPVPNLVFVADMERRMQQGFPPPGKRRLPKIGLRPRAAAAVAASSLLALVAVVSLTGGEERASDAPVSSAVMQESSRGGAEPSDSAAKAVPTFESNAHAQPVPPPDIDPDVAPGANVRRIARSAQLTLASDPDEFDRLADAIFRTADRSDGFVLRSSFTQGEDGFSGGFFELRVPSGQLQPTLNELSQLATVRSRSESGTDVTGTFVSIRDRLRTSLALRTSLLRRLELAVTDTAVSAIRRRLTIVGNRITRLRNELRGIRERTEYATVFVELVDEDAGVATGETDEAIDDAVGSLGDILNFLIRAAAILVPVTLAAALGWLLAGRARRRARERALA